RMLGIVQDDPEITAPEKLRYDAALVVRDGVAPSGEIGIQDVGAGEYAIVLHTGPYNTLGQTYMRMFGEWLPESGRELENLVEDLRHCAMPYTCPHGRPTLIEMNFRELEKKFGRSQ
ncbi:MAG: GyrI-like domain-containing protein, partial [Verrucomicrobiota bacterium]